FLFIFTDTSSPYIYTLSLHDALPISARKRECRKMQEFMNRLFPQQQMALLSLFVSRLLVASILGAAIGFERETKHKPAGLRTNIDRKSTRLNSSHDQISYAVFCLKKK